MRLDPDIRGLAERMQTRRRAAKGRVAEGEIMHLRFMGAQDCFDRARCNLEQLVEKTGDEALTALADVGNYGLAILKKTAEGAE